MIKTLIENAFGDLPHENPVVVAVSGGSDSMALLLLAESWARLNGCELHVVTIDHGLRPEAAAEASFVAAVAAGMDLPHVTLCWEGSKPAFGIQESARTARYGLLDEYAHEIGASIILTGHTKEDQAETIAMRSLRRTSAGDGRGLSGMARETWLYGGVRIVRPLLDYSRNDLRDVLKLFQQNWIEDPSNEDCSFERIRIRRNLSEDAKRQVLDFGRLCGRLRKIAARDTADLLADTVQILPGPVFSLSDNLLHRLQAASDPIAWQALQIVVSLAGGQATIVPRSKLGSLVAFLAKIPSAPSGQVRGMRPMRCSVSGALVEFGRSGLLIYREVRNLSALILEPGEAAIWDGRLHVFNGSATPIFMEPASASQIRAFENLRGNRYRTPARAALFSTPILHVQTGVTGNPPCLPLVEAGGLPRGVETRIASPAIEHFSPDFDTPIREWLRKLDRHVAASIQP